MGKTQVLETGVCKDAASVLDPSETLPPTNLAAAAEPTAPRLHSQHCHRYRSLIRKERFVGSRASANIHIHEHKPSPSTFRRFSLMLSECGRVNVTPPYTELESSKLRLRAFIDPRSCRCAFRAAIASIIQVIKTQACVSFNS
jgi:hypothetical protein